MVRLFSIPLVECCSAWRLVITLLACAGLVIAIAVRLRRLAGD